jgi:hypothetical protein
MATITRIYKVIEVLRAAGETRNLSDSFTFSDSLVRYVVNGRVLQDTLTFSTNLDYNLTAASPPGGPTAPTFDTAEIGDTR